MTGNTVQFFFSHKNKPLGKGIGKTQTMRRLQKIYLRQITQVCNMQKKQNRYINEQKKKKKKASIEAGDIVPQALHKDTNSQLRKKKNQKICSILLVFTEMII